ncbi:MAG TPA: HD domain-containing phosphohydrolase [Trueperaceae bacterium]
MPTPLRILLVEDNPDDIELLLRELQRAGFAPDYVTVSSEAAYLDQLVRGFDLILADYTLPGFGAMQALEHLRNSQLDIPFIMVTGTVGEELAVECMKAGAADYLLKDRLGRLGPAIRQALQAKELREERRQAEREREDLLRREQQARKEAELQRAQVILAYDTTIAGWGRALDLKDEETAGHSQRVTDMTVRLARHMGMSEEELVHVRRGALLHDIGKMGVPDSVLLKPGKLDAAEWEVMKRHTTYGYELLLPISFLRPALAIPYCHHEKWDGSGYPQGLKGEEIPLPARIFAVVDVWDALGSDRPYRAAWSPEKIASYLQEEAGRHFDPAVVTAFFELLAEN